MRHPLEFIPSANRKPIFFAFLAGTLILFAIFRVLDAPLHTDVSGGIVSFELAGTPEKAQAMIDSWNVRAGLFASLGLGLDYLFMPTYAIALSLGILLAAGRHPGGFTKLGAWMGWGALAAPLFDAMENYGLLHSLLNGASAPWPQVSAFCATVKFTLLLLGLVYALAGWLWPRQK